MAAHALLKTSTNRSDALDESWATPYGLRNSMLAYPRSARGSQARFNINNLVDGNGTADPLAREESERPGRLGWKRWAQLFTDRIDGQRAHIPDGAEDANYMARVHPTAHPTCRSPASRAAGPAWFFARELRSPAALHNGVAAGDRQRLYRQRPRARRDDARAAGIRPSTRRSWPSDASPAVSPRCRNSRPR
jgi:hypothetical protein